MGRSSHQVRQSDVTAWGIAAIVCGGLAVMSVNVAGLLPESTMSRLHSTRLASGNLTELHTLVQQARATTQDVMRENQTLASRFNLMDDTSSETVRRVAAVEQSMPLLIESLPYDSDIDRSLLTASVGEDTPDLIAVDGGQMTVERTPMFAHEDTMPGGQPLPPPVHETAAREPSAAIATHPEALADGLDLGAVLGDSVGSEEVDEVWESLLEKAGPLLLGLEPRVTPSDDGSGVSLIAGPMRTESAAETLCDHVRRIGVPCTVRSFAGTPLSH